MGVTGVVYKMEDKWEICGSYRCGKHNGRCSGNMWDLQLRSTELERIWRYVGVTSVVYGMEDNGRYAGVIGVIYKMREVREI